MRWIALMLFGLIAFEAAATAPRWSLGAGYEATVEASVNPDDQQASSLGQIFASMAFHPWSALLEADMSQNQSGEGNYSIRTSTYTTMLWGRYEPMARWKVSPFLGAGVGWRFQNVVTNFGTANDERWSDGGARAGLALGAMADFWKHWKVEAELRIVKAEFAEQPATGFVIRSGYTF